MIVGLSQHTEMVATIAAAIAALSSALGVGINTRYQHKQNKNIEKQLALTKEESDLNKKELDRIRERDESERMERLLLELIQTFNALSSASSHLISHQGSPEETTRWYTEFQSSLEGFRFWANSLKQNDSDFLWGLSLHLEEIHSNIMNLSMSKAMRKEDQVIAEERGVDTSEWMYLDGDLETRPHMSEPYYWSSPDILRAFHESVINKIYALRMRETSSTEDLQDTENLVEHLQNYMLGFLYVVTKTNPFPPYPPDPSSLTREEVHLDALIKFHGMLVHNFTQRVHGIAQRYRMN